MVLAIGIVVDDAIVVVENVERVMEEEPELTPARGHQEGDGADHRADHRHHPRAAVGVRADRLHPRHLRHAVPPVRGDDLGRDADLGDQRADPLARAVRGVPAPHRAASAASWAASGAASTACATAMPRSSARLVRRRACSPSCWSLALSAAASSASACARPPGSCPRRTRAPSSSRCSCRTAPASPAPATWCSGSRTIAKRHPADPERARRSSASRCSTAATSPTPPSWSCG